MTEYNRRHGKLMNEEKLKDEIQVELKQLADYQFIPAQTIDNIDMSYEEYIGKRIEIMARSIAAFFRQDVAEDNVRIFIPEEHADNFEKWQSEGRLLKGNYKCFTKTIEFESGFIPEDVPDWIESEITPAFFSSESPWRIENDN